MKTSKRIPLCFVRLIVLLCAIAILAPLAITVGAASGTKYESESNNTYSTATTTFNDYDSYGRISSTSDIDYWSVQFSKSGTANFYLGDIPSGCDYDMRVYSSNGTTLLGSSTNSGNTYELLRLTVAAGTRYYIRINSASGYSTSSYYQFRTKVYPSNTITSVPLYQQNQGDTCGSACGRMILKRYGISVTEDEFKMTASSYATPGCDYTCVSAICAALNSYLGSAGVSHPYRYADVSSYSLQGYTDLMLANIIYNHPVQVVMAVSNTTYFPYTTNGHYVVLKGMQYNAASETYTAIVNDPHINYCGVYSLPISALRSYNNAHSGYIIYSEG